METVWGLPRHLLDTLISPFQGFLPVEAADSRATTLRDWGARFEAHGEFRPRHEAEEDPSFQQIIPYVWLHHGGESLLMERLPTQGEARLHHASSIGVGGHINPEPPGPGTLLERGLDRELREEVDLREPLAAERIQLRGFINDDATAVGQVHFGVACTVEVPTRVAIREVDKMRGEWVSTESLSSYLERMETWSQFFVAGGPVGSGGD